MDKYIGPTLDIENQIKINVLALKDLCFHRWGLHSWSRHCVGHPGDSGTNPVTAITFSCAAIHSPAVHNL